MSICFKQSLVIVFASTIASMLFLFGLTFPLNIRVSGDALGYLKIADSFSGFGMALTYAGDRTVGFPIFEYSIRQILSEFSSTVFLLQWINTIGVAMLATHLLATWLFCFWADSVGHIKSATTRHLLFIYLATYPALIGHITSPLTDTFSIDIILLALVSLNYALQAIRPHTLLAFSLFASVCFGFAVLVRPASVIGVSVALLVCLFISWLGTSQSRIALGIALTGYLIMLAPSLMNCNEKYGRFCLQAPQTFNAVLSAQEGLRGARLMWSQQNGAPGTLPMVIDDTMFNHYYQECRIEKIFGWGDSSFTGCLLARPLTLSAFVAKKWLGLFDHFRFTPYVENLTPAWLRNLSRMYGALSWIGLALCFAALVKLRDGEMRFNLKQRLPSNLATIWLISYSAVMLAQHTVLHTEERYGFPLIPLCALVLFEHCERSIAEYRSGGWSGVAPQYLFCLLVLVLFIVQITAWDKISFVQTS